MVEELAPGAQLFSPLAFNSTSWGRRFGSASLSIPQRSGSFHMPSTLA
jgi:hypothetical protein